jgi:hypothetical protein
MILDNKIENQGKIVYLHPIWGRLVLTASRIEQ